MENPIKMDDLGGFPIIFGNTHIYSGDFGVLYGYKYMAHHFASRNTRSTAMEILQNPWIPLPTYPPLT